MKESEKYRQGVGIVLLNKERKVFVAKRIDNTVEAWQMPQGGIDDDEAPQTALFRELEEEIGIPEDLVNIVYELEDWLYYDLPIDLQKILWKGKYKGQMQKWFVLEFLGTDSDINIQTVIPEFCEWKWSEPQQLPNIIVDFKKDLYTQLLVILQNQRLVN